jgi:hypothetical protein
MYLVQILLPVYDNDGHAILHDTYHRIREELVAQFGGLTAFTQSPAEGLWTPADKQTQRDEIIVIEVMVTDFDFAWWRAYKAALEGLLRQESVVIRSLAMQLL